jgi:hypothetical protein
MNDTKDATKKSLRTKIMNSEGEAVKKKEEEKQKHKEGRTTDAYNHEK